MSRVYDDISARLDAEQTAIETEAKAVIAAHDSAIRAADAVHAAAVEEADRAWSSGMEPLRARSREVDALRSFLGSQHTATADPQQPSATAGDATTSAPDEQPAQPSEPQPEPSIPPAEESAPTPDPAPSETSEPESSSASGDSSQPPSPTASPEPLLVDTAADAVEAAQSRGIDTTQPIAVPLTTGQIAVVTAGDVLAAKDPETPDESLTTTQLDLRRNSDWP